MGDRRKEESGWRKEGRRREEAKEGGRERQRRKKEGKRERRKEHREGREERETWSAEEGGGYKWRKDRGTEKELRKAGS